MGLHLCQADKNQLVHHFLKINLGNSWHLAQPNFLLRPNFLHKHREFGHDINNKENRKPLADSEERSRLANSNDYSWKRAKFGLIKLWEGHKQRREGRRWASRQRNQSVWPSSASLGILIPKKVPGLVLKPVILHFFSTKWGHMKLYLKFKTLNTSKKI